jgi:hypothetical protein
MERPAVCLFNHTSPFNVIMFGLLIGVSKANPQIYMSLATKEDVEELEDLYRKLLTRQPGEEAEEPLDIPVQTSIAMQDVSNADIGVGNVSHFSVKALEQQLGFQDTLPPVFNLFRHSDGLNPWDVKDSQDQKGRLERLSLHWHQLCAVLAVVQKVFSASDGDAELCTGILIADEVGLGKTAVGMALIAFMANAVVSRRSAVQPPPCIGTSDPQRYSPSSRGYF